MTHVHATDAAKRASDNGSGSDQRLGELLVQRGDVDASAVERALALQPRRAERLGELLIEHGRLDAATLIDALAQQRGIERIDLDQQPPDPAAVTLVSPDIANQWRVLPVADDGGVVRLAMADPFDTAAEQVVRVSTGRRVRRVYCPDSELGEAIRRALGSNVSRMIADLETPPLEGPPEGSPGEHGGAGYDVNDPSSLVELQELAREPSVVNLVNLILLEAVEAKASDVHIEPFEKVLRVKYRIDGVLQEVSPPPRHLYAAIASRIKIMGGMNIAERFVPQDGHIAFAGPRGKVDVRVGTVPTVFGESVAMRLLDRSIGLIDLEQIGFPQPLLERLGVLLAKPHGIVLVTGPTGSGKTTTLYAALNRIYSPEKKILTIEDPVEYQLDGVNQIPVNRKRGVGFAEGLRAILRQDPDVIMVGEVRDRETADIAIRSALTGHLVFSTLHTNDAAGAVTRLLDMGVEPFLLGSSLEGVLAQRLVRRICPDCKTQDTLSPAVLRRLGSLGERAASARFYKGVGCRKCRQTGYRGRTGVFELLRITDKLREVILRRGTMAELLAAAPGDHQTLRDYGYEKAAAGLTTIEEVLRVTQDTPAEEAMGTE